jgi:hypothetical protein
MWICRTVNKKADASHRPSQAARANQGLFQKGPNMDQEFIDSSLRGDGCMGLGSKF